MGLILNSEQKILLSNLRKWYIHKTKPYYSYSGAAGTGKAQPDSTLIPIPEGGYKRLDELQIGDNIFNIHGQPVPITGIYPQDIDDVYEITFTDGRTTKCNLSHLWPTISSKGNIVVKELKEIISDYEIYDKRGHVYHKYTIPMCPKIHYKNNIYLPIDPWIIGVLIGNGCLREKYLTISSGNSFVPEKMAKILGFKCKRNNIKNYSYTFYQNNIPIKTFDFLCNLITLYNKYSYEKSIPSIYKYTTIDNRKRLLSGLLDTDGSISKDRYKITYSTTSRRLKDDIVEICMSLGYRVYVTTDNRIEKYTNGERFTIFISCPDKEKVDLFTHGEKLNRSIKALNYNNFSNHNLLTITKIQHIGKESQRCIMIDDPDHIYITENFIPTHNTTVIKAFIEDMGLKINQVAAMAYVGKAVLVLLRHGLNATTIHSLIYRPILENVPDIDGTLDRNGNIVKNTRIKFMLRDKLNDSIRLLIVDEAGTVNDHMRDHILSFGIPTVFIGDNNQLPPIYGKSSVMEYPDFTLNEIMRQSLDSPIVFFSQCILNDVPLDFGEYGSSKIIGSIPIDKNVLTDYDIIICGKNKTREKINNDIRQNVLKIPTYDPIIGDKLINRQNDWDYCIDNIYLTNGLIGYVTDIDYSSLNKNYITFDFRPDFMETSFQNLCLDYKYLNTDISKRNEFGISKYNKFEYGYCITGHLSQGSEYDRVLFIDQPFYDKETTKRLRYTAITRARESITIVKNPYY